MDQSDCSIQTNYALTFNAQVAAEAGKAHASTQTPPTLGGGAGIGGGEVERGEDVVELLTVAEGGGGGRPNSSFSLNDRESPSQASSVVVAGREGAGPVENRIPLIDNSGLLLHDSTNKKVTSLTNEGTYYTVYYSGTSDKGPSEIGTTSLQRTLVSTPC